MLILQKKFRPGVQDNMAGMPECRGWVCVTQNLISEFKEFNLKRLLYLEKTKSKLKMAPGSSVECEIKLSLW